MGKQDEGGKKVDKMTPRGGQNGTKVDILTPEMDFWQGADMWHGDCNIQGENVKARETAKASSTTAKQHAKQRLLQLMQKTQIV